MAAILSYNDFTTGEFAISSFNTAMDISGKLDEICVEVEKDMLTDLFGDALYLDFSKNKTAPKYSVLIDGYKVGADYATYDPDGTKVFYGLKEMLKYFTYYFYCIQQNSFNTVVGEISPSQENGTQAFASQKLVKAFNFGVEEYNRALAFINFQNSTATVYDKFDPYLHEKINIFGI